MQVHLHSNPNHWGNFGPYPHTPRPTCQTCRTLVLHLSNFIAAMTHDLRSSVFLSYLRRVGESLYFRPHTSFNIKDSSMIEKISCSRWWVFNINIFVACSQWALMMQSENIALCRFGPIRDAPLFCFGSVDSEVWIPLRVMDWKT